MAASTGPVNHALGQVLAPAGDEPAARSAFRDARDVSLHNEARAFVERAELALDGLN